MNMPAPMNEKTWYHYKTQLHKGVKRAADAHLQEAAEQVREMYAAMKIGILDADDVLDISVSFDGSWHKRGRTSHNGITTVIESFSGLIIDFVALSNYCKSCEMG